MLVARTVAAVIGLGGCVAIPVTAAGENPQAAPRTFEIPIVQRRVPSAQRVLRATEGERIELRWSADEPLLLHLHGYDIETRVAPGRPAVTAFAARLTGRFFVPGLRAGAGDFWVLVSPWKTLSLWAGALARRIRPAARFGMRRTLSAGVGVWPAAVLLLVFAWLEMVWQGNSSPANIAWLALGYSLLTWAAMFVFGREAWLRSGEVFAVYFGMLAKLAPSEVRSGNEAVCELYLRPPAAGLLDPRPISTSAAAFVIVMLGTVTYDDARETPLWASVLDRPDEVGKSSGDPHPEGPYRVSDVLHLLLAVVLESCRHALFYRAPHRV